MQKNQLNVRLDEAVIRKLNQTADRYSMTANTLLAAAACELSRVQPENLWHALGRIAAGEAQELTAPPREALPSSRRPAARKAITDVVPV